MDLTTIGISVGVASLVAMLSLGVGLQQLATRRLAGSGMFDTVFVTSRQDFRGYDKEDDAKAPNPEKSLRCSTSLRVRHHQTCHT